MKSSSPSRGRKIYKYKREKVIILMETIEALRHIELTEGEVKVYMALLSLGPSSTGIIIKEARVSSSKVYPILDKLISMGLVSYIKRGKKKIFQTTSPEKILDLLDKRKKDIEVKKKEIQKILPALLKKQKSREEKHEAIVYEGQKAVKTYYRSLLKKMRKGDERLVFGARSGYPIAKGAKYFFQNYARNWSKKGVKTRIIFNEDLRGSKSIRIYQDLELTEVRYLPQVTLSSIGIQRDNVDMLIWTKETAVVFVIKSKEVAKTFREYFKTLWEMAGE